MRSSQFTGGTVDITWVVQHNHSSGSDGLWVEPIVYPQLHLFVFKKLPLRDVSLMIRTVDINLTASRGYLAGAIFVTNACRAFLQSILLVQQRNIAATYAV
jgi:hypothetical protein